MAGFFSAKEYSLEGTEYTELVLISEKGFTLKGNHRNNLIQGGDGDDTVYAGLGDDLIIGGDGKGNDKYYGGAGADTVKYTSATWGITVDLARGTAASLSNPALRGNRDAANIGSDRLYEIENVTAGNYNDVLSGNQLANNIEGEDGNDRIDGKAGNDVLHGGAGNDSLTGGTGADVMAGGAGDDVYEVDSQGDFVTELAGQGTDLIRTTLTHFDLIDYDHVENLTYTGRSNSSLIGSDIDNVIRGGSRSDIIEGGGGSDTLYGGDGTDLLNGFYEDYGNDASFGEDIDAKLAAERLIPPDVLYGGKGSDIYIGGGDRGNEQQIVELKNEGVDIIFGSYTEYVLPDNVENYCNVMVQIDVSAPYFEIVGNSLNNLIQSSPEWSIMPEQADVDAELQWYLKNLNTNKFLSTVNNNPDIAIERFFGMGGMDTLLGGAGDDYLSGGAGRDRLTGGSGADQFAFDAALNRNTNVDTITDFVSGQDQIVLDSTVFSRFSAGADITDHLSATGRALDSDDYLIYSATNKVLYYDADGNGSGAAVAFAVLTGVPTLNAADFLIGSGPQAAWAQGAPECHAH